MRTTAGEPRQHEAFSRPNGAVAPRPSHHREAAPDTAPSIELTMAVAAVVDAARCSYPGRILLDSEPARASIAPGTLHRLLWLLLEQAMRNGGEEGTLRVTVAASADRARLFVEYQRPRPDPMGADERRVLEMVNSLVQPVSGVVRHTTLGTRRSLVEVTLPVPPGDRKLSVGTPMPRVLLHHDGCRLTADALRVVMVHRGYTTVDVSTTLDDTLALADSGRYDVCVAHLGPGGETLVPRLRRLAPEVRVVMLREVGSTVADVPGAALVDVTCRVDDILAVIEQPATATPSAPTSTRGRLRKRDQLVDKQDARGRYSLTAREEEVLVRLSNGERTAEIAAQMGIKVSTARTHIQSVLTKLRVHSKVEAVTMVAREGTVASER